MTTIELALQYFVVQISSNNESEIDTNYLSQTLGSEMNPRVILNTLENTINSLSIVIRDKNTNSIVISSSLLPPQE